MVRRAECVLVYGSVPLDDMNSLVGLAPKKSVMDFGLPVLFGATFVFSLCALMDTEAPDWREAKIGQHYEQTLKKMREIADDSHS